MNMRQQCSSRVARDRTLSTFPRAIIADLAPFWATAWRASRTEIGLNLSQSMIQLRNSRKRRNEQYSEAPLGSRQINLRGRCPPEHAGVRHLRLLRQGIT